MQALYIYINAHTQLFTNLSGIHLELDHFADASLLLYTVKIIVFLKCYDCIRLEGVFINMLQA